MHSLSAWKFHPFVRTPVTAGAGQLLMGKRECPCTAPVAKENVIRTMHACHGFILCARGDSLEGELPRERRRPWRRALRRRPAVLPAPAEPGVPQRPGDAAWLPPGALLCLHLVGAQLLDNPRGDGGGSAVGARG